MLGNATFSDLTFSGNRSATKTFNGKVIGIKLYLQQDPRVSFKVLKIEPPETDGIILYIQRQEPVDLKVIEIDSPMLVVDIVLNLNKSSGLEL